MKTLTAYITIIFMAAFLVAGPAISAEDQTAPQTYSKVPADFDSLDNDGDKNISPDEANGAVKGYFTTIDQNSDRRLSEQEYGTFVEQYPSLVDYGEMEEAE